jgi:transcriptional regulator with XRE-family HTH domain
LDDLGMADSNFEFSSRLKKAIQGAGITQKTLAKELCIEQGTISRYVSQGRVPEWDILVKLADRLSVSCDWLLTGTDPSSRAEKPPGTGPMDPDQVGQGSLTVREEELLVKALEVLRAGKMEGSFDKALKSSIEALHTAVKNASESEKKAAGSQRAKKAKRGATKDATL